MLWHREAESAATIPQEQTKVGNTAQAGKTFTAISGSRCGDVASNLGAAARNLKHGRQTRRCDMKIPITALALATLIAVPAFTQPVVAASQSRHDSSPSRHD